MWGNSKEKLLHLLQTFILVMVKEMCQLRYIRAINFTWMWLNSGSPTGMVPVFLCLHQLCGLGPVGPVWLFGLELSPHIKRSDHVEVKLFTQQELGGQLPYEIPVYDAKCA